MSKGTACSCTGTREERLKNWVIIQYKCNHSAFNGYHETRSDYSSLRCMVCRAVWRTKSDYVFDVKLHREKNPVADPWATITKTVVGIFAFFLLSCTKEKFPGDERIQEPRCYWGLLISQKLDTTLIHGRVDTTWKKKIDTLWQDKCLQGRWVDTIRKEVGKVYWLVNCDPALGYELEKRHYQLK